MRQGLQARKGGWDAVLADPQRPVTSTLLAQAPTASDRKRCMRKGFQHPGGSHQALLTGLAHRYTLVPYQRRAQQAGPGGVAVEGGRVPPSDWMLTLQILTAGGLRCAAETLYH